MNYSAGTSGESWKRRRSRRRKKKLRSVIRGSIQPNRCEEATVLYRQRSRGCLQSVTKEIDHGMMKSLTQARKFMAKSLKKRSTRKILDLIVRAAKYPTPILTSVRDQLTEDAMLMTDFTCQELFLSHLDCISVYLSCLYIINHKFKYFCPTSH